MKKALITLCCLFAFVLAAQNAAFAAATFTGNYLQFGVDDSGGLINSEVGLKYDPSGSSSFGANDFILPGTPFEFYSVGANGSTLGTAGYDYGNTFGATTSSMTFGALTRYTTTFTAGSLQVTQTIGARPGNDYITFGVSLTNIGDELLTDVAYARGLDPDQDISTAADTFHTTNTIINNNLVEAYGQYSDMRIGIENTGSIASVASISQSWATSPYTLLSGMDDGDGDYAIALAWALGDLAAGETVDLDFKYVLATGSSATPIPGAVWLLGSGLAGLVGLRKKFTA